MRPPIYWLITDTHLFHDRMVSFCGRPDNFSDIIIKNLKYYISDQDVLIHLGDVIFHKYSELGNIMSSIKGRKVLTIGNHDRKSAIWYMNHGGFAFASKLFQHNDILFSHKPIHPLPSGVRLNIHGHWHNTRHHPIPEFYNTTQYKLLAIEETNYMPVKLSDFICRT